MEATEAVKATNIGEHSFCENWTKDKKKYFLRNEIMNYKLNPELRKIISPIILIFPDGTEKFFTSGAETANAVFDKRYDIVEITAKDNMIRLKLIDQQDMPTINWIGEEAVSFF